MKYYVYVLKSEKDGKLYIGFTKNIEERLKRHNSGRVLSTKSRSPFKLLHCEIYNTLEDALDRERYLKGNKYIRTRWA